MSGHSERELVEWMKERSRMFGWGMVAVMDRAKVNRLLIQEYIRHFTEGSYLAPQSGEIETDDSWLNTIEHAVLDVPRLSFENSNLQNSKARLRMAMVGGNRVRLQKVGGRPHEVRQIDQYGPQQRPELEMDLDLSEVPGTVAEGGGIFLDLKDCDDFLFKLAASSNEQRDMGSFFKNKFQALEEAKRIYQLGRVERGLADLMHPDRFLLRTQPRDEQVKDGDGAVVSFIRLEGDQDGSVPTSNDTFKYMIPNNIFKKYSAAVAISSERLAISQMLAALQNVMQGAEFKAEYVEENGRRIFTGASLVSGSMHIDEVEIVREGFTNVWPDLVVKLRVLELTCDLADNLKITVNSDDPRKVDVSCTLRGDLSAQVLSLKSESKRFESYLERVGINLDYLYEVCTDRYEYKLEASYELVNEIGGKLKNTKFELKPIREPNPFRYRSLAEHIDNGGPDDDVWKLILLFTTLAVMLALMNPVGSVYDGLNLQKYIEGALKKSFPLASPLKKFIDETVKLNFDNAITNNQTHLPLDAVAFGKVNPGLTRFTIDDLEPIVATGAKRHFKTLPAKAGLQWRVEPKEGYGKIDPVTGEYTAPEAGSFDDVFIRGRIIAKDANGFESSALLTVVRSGLMLNPLVVTTWPDGEVDLQAGALGSNGHFEWRFENAEPHGSFKIPEATTADMTYVAGPAETRPKAFYIDEVSVVHKGTGEQRTAVILIKDQGPSLDIETTLDADQRSLTLKAFDYGDDVTQDTVWEIIRGPGTLENNRYTADAASSEPFAMLTGAFVDGRRTYEGVVVVPLPLHKNTRAFSALRQEAIVSQAVV